MNFRLSFFAGTFLLAAVCATSGFAAELESPATPLRKLQRGFLNVALSPWELAHELSQNKKTDSAVPTWFGGAGRGAAYTAGRALTGVYEMVTFPLPWPANYEPVLQPEFAWQHFEESEA